MTVSIDKARSFLKRKQQARQEHLSQLHARAVADCTAIVRMISQRYSWKGSGSIYVQPRGAYKKSWRYIRPA